MSEFKVGDLVYYPTRDNCVLAVCVRVAAECPALKLDAAARPITKTVAVIVLICLKEGNR